MQSTEFSWTTSDNLKMYAKEWTPDGGAKAMIVLIHGLGEHINRYEHVAKAFTDANYVVRGFDLRGHGQSEGKRGHAAGYDQLAGDIDQFITMAHRTNASLPVFLYGHSLGGALVLYYGETRQNQLKGIVATSPGLAPATMPSPAKMLAARIFSRIAPGFQMPNDLDLGGLSHDPQVAEKYKSDPLVHPLISARLGLELINKGQYLIEHAGNFPLPLLLLQGSADRLVNPDATAQFASRVPADLITYHVFPGGFHELHNEPQKDEVLKMMVNWLGQHLS